MIAEHGERVSKDTKFSLQCCLPTGVTTEAEPASTEHHPCQQSTGTCQIHCLWLTDWLFLPFLGQWVLKRGHFPGKDELQQTLPVNPVCSSWRWGERKGFGAEPLSSAFICAHARALALQNFTLEVKTFPWRQKGLGSTEYLLIIILTGFWPWALFFLFSKHFLWVWKEEVKLSLQCICVWLEHVKMESIKQERSQDFTSSLINHLLQLRSLYGIVKMYQIPWVTFSWFHLGFFVAF